MNPYGLDFQPGERVRLDRDGSLPITGRVLSANPVGITLLAYDDGKPSPFPNRDDPPPVMIVWAAVSHVWLLDRVAGDVPSLKSRYEAMAAMPLPPQGLTVSGYVDPIPDRVTTEQAQSRGSIPAEIPVQGVRTEWGGGAPPKAPDFVPDPEPSFHEAFQAELKAMKQAGTLYGEAKIPWKDR